VTNARGGQSNHNFGTAIDVFPVLGDGQLHFDAAHDAENIRILKSISGIGKANGFEWGGDWTSMKDYPHFQMQFGRPMQEMRDMYRQANGSIDDMDF
jgi:hypothetical protein